MHSSVAEFESAAHRWAKSFEIRLDRRKPCAARSDRSDVERMLCEGGYIYVCLDSNGLPCFLSPSGRMLIAVGTYRTLAYVNSSQGLALVWEEPTTAVWMRLAQARPELPRHGPRFAWPRMRQKNLGDVCRRGDVLLLV